ncbi:hypothetical protein [Nitrosospira sp. Nsp1]|uniref:hypothetical protein n=1 Tax=Nitrosospira sp. Nsp1 TaxID=136547 RepID=UPI001C409D65|nr:hypothetical protein [Nitrosospira sp. Nsp1]
MPTAMHAFHVGAQQNAIDIKLDLMANFCCYQFIVAGQDLDRYAVLGERLERWCGALFI